MFVSTKLTAAVRAVFGASFQSIRARAFYPINDKQQVGGGQMLNVNIPAHSHNKLLFPFAIK